LATILAHIQIQPGMELEFETLIGELFEATAQEPGKRHYEYWRSAEPGLYYCLLAFDDFPSTPSSLTRRANTMRRRAQSSGD